MHSGGELGPLLSRRPPRTGLRKCRGRLVHLTRLVRLGRRGTQASVNTSIRADRRMREGRPRPCVFQQLRILSRSAPAFHLLFSVFSLMPIFLFHTFMIATSAIARFPPSCLDFWSRYSFSPEARQFIEIGFQRTFSSPRYSCQQAGTLMHAHWCVNDVPTQPRRIDSYHP